MEYVKTPLVRHSSNQWGKDKHGYDNISNMVYKMYCHVYENTNYDCDTKTKIPIAWYVSWDVSTNSPKHSNYGRNIHSIARQYRKRYIDKAAAYNYIEGRKKAYAYLFEEISPPIPQEYADIFCVNGQLLPGYTVEEKEHVAASLRDCRN